MWMVYVWALVLSLLMAVVFNSIWGKKRDTFVILSVLIWCALTAIYLQMMLLGNNFWQIFLLGIPLQLGTILWASLLLKNKSHDPATIRAKREYQKEKALKKKAKQEARAEHKREQQEAKKQKKTQKAEKAQNQQPTAPTQTQETATKQADEPKQPEESLETSEPEIFVPSKNENIIQDLK